MLFCPWNQTEMKFKNNYFHFNNIKSSIPGLVFKNACCATSSASQGIQMCILSCLYLIGYNFARFTRCAENDTAQDHFRCLNVMVCYRLIHLKRQGVIRMPWKTRCAIPVNNVLLQFRANFCWKVKYENNHILAAVFK